MYRWRQFKDKLFMSFIVLLSIIAILPLFSLISTVTLNGVKVLYKAGLNFLTDLPPTPLSNDVGGIAPALVGSAILVFLTLPITTLIALLAAIMTTEFPNHPVSRATDTICRAFASIPTIIVSMVVYTLIVIPMGTFSTLAGSIALTIVSLPYAYTYFSVALTTVPQTYREAAYSLAMSRWQVLKHVLIPIAVKGIATGALMTFARAMGETAALLFTTGRFRSGVNVGLNTPTDAIPLLIFDFIQTPFTIYHEVVWGASFILLVTYLTIFLAVKVFVRGVTL